MGLNVFPLSGVESIAVKDMALKECAGVVAWLMTDPWWLHCVTAVNLSDDHVHLQLFILQEHLYKAVCIKCGTVQTQSC